MGLLIKNGNVEYVDSVSLYRMSTDQAIAFLLFLEAEARRHEKDILDLNETIDEVKRVHGLRKINAEGYYVRSVDYSIAYDKSGAEHDD